MSFRMSHPDSARAYMASLDRQFISMMIFAFCTHVKKEVEGYFIKQHRSEQTYKGANRLGLWTVVVVNTFKLYMKGFCLNFMKKKKKVA